MFSPDDTIVALATAPGRGGLAVVRLSGRRALGLASALLDGVTALRPRRATLVRVVVSSGVSGRAIDEAVATFFPGPGSYTGEDVVELSLHGSPCLAVEVIEGAVAAGARMAGPGEFTLRAFLNGRVDLTQAEAVRDLVEATTPVQARMAFDQVRGGLAARIGEIERVLFDVRARLEASCDFPEEGYHFITVEEARGAVRAAGERIDGLLRDARRGRLLREGVTVAIVGAPNVGKSTLFNRLAGADRAIVTAIPGTTRDLITEEVVLLGTRVSLVDTAGIRSTVDPVEREGVARAVGAAGAADVVVVLLDATRGLSVEDEQALAATHERARIVAVNKCDAGRCDDGALGAGLDVRALGLSALTGEGVDALAREIWRVSGLCEVDEPPAVSNVRHVRLLEVAQEALRRAERVCCDMVGQTPENVLLSDIDAACGALEEVTGQRTRDGLLDEIFSKFCIGK
jgi:tRNA modification GTPase